MSENIRDVLSELIDSYGINILEDPDRLSQFLEDRCALQAEEAFHLTFALRYLLKCGWRVNSARAVLDEEQEERLCQQLGFTAGQSKEVAALINGAVADKYEDGRPAGEGFVATPGNLRRISGGISNRPRTMRMRKKSLYNGVILLAAMLVLGVLFFQIGSQRTPVGDELRIAFFAPMSGPEARLSHVQLRAAQLAVERINFQGPLREEYKLKVVGFDLPKDPAKAVASVKKAMKDKSFLVMMLGANNGTVAEIARLAESIEAPLIVISPTPPGEEELMDAALPYLYTFSLVNDAKARGKVLSYFATQALHKKKIALYYDSSDKLSEETYLSARKWAVGFGAKTVAELSYNGKKESGHTAAMRAIFESGADLLIIPGTGKDSAKIVSEARAAGFQETILGEGYTDKTYADAGEALKGSWWVNEVSALDPPIRSVLKEYRSLYNENCPPEDVMAAILAYDGVRWIAAALQSTPGFRGEAIRHTLLATKNLPLTHATLTIDPRSHMPLNKAMAVVYCAHDKGIFQRRIRVNKD